jgi:hypothetical protein
MATSGTKESSFTADCATKQNTAKVTKHTCAIRSSYHTASAEPPPKSPAKDEMKETPAFQHLKYKTPPMRNDKPITETTADTLSGQRASAEPLSQTSNDRSEVTSHSPETKDTIQSTNGKRAQVSSNAVANAAVAAEKFRENGGKERDETTPKNFVANGLHNGDNQATLSQSIQHDGDEAVLYIGGYGIPGCNTRDHYEVKDDYQSYLTPIAVDGEYPEIESFSALSHEDGNLEDDIQPTGKFTKANITDKPMRQKGPATLTKTKARNGTRQRSGPSEPEIATDIERYRNLSGFPKPLHFLWIKKKKRWHPTEQGQFEDANEQNLVGPQYDPKTLAPSQQLQQQISHNHYPFSEKLHTGSRAYPPINQLHAAMMQAQQQQLKVPAMAKNQFTRGKEVQHQQQVQAAKIELVKAYEKLQALQKSKTTAYR